MCARAMGPERSRQDYFWNLLWMEDLSHGGGIGELVKSTFRIAFLDELGMILPTIQSVCFAPRESQCFINLIKGSTTCFVGRIPPAQVLFFLLVVLDIFSSNL